MCISKNAYAFASVIGVVLILFTEAPAAKAESIILFSDNFDTNLGQNSDLPVGTTVDSSTTGTFTVTGGNVDVVGPNSDPGLCDTTPETGSCIDLDGDTAGQITSTSIFLAPGSDTLAFDLFGNERGGSPNSTTVTFGSFYSHTFITSSGAQDPESIGFDVAVTTSAQIVFTSNDFSGDTTGALIDNVVVTSNGSVSPEPGPAVLLIASLPLLCFARRRGRGNISPHDSVPNQPPGRSRTAGGSRSESPRVHQVRRSHVGPVIARFLMGCDTTGIEPDLALLKYRKLVGGVRMRTGMLAALVFSCLTSGIAAAQSSRDDWQHLQGRADFELRLDHSLEDAPLAAEEKAQIYSLVDIVRATEASQPRPKGTWHM
jgi:hypothetical protein